MNWLQDPVVVEYGEAYQERMRGAGSPERYLLAAARYMEFEAERMPAFLRPAAIVSFFRDGLPAGIIATAFKATSEEMAALERLPQLAPENETEADRLKALPYAVYLKTDHWDRVRKAELRAAEYRCRLCYAESGLEVHHRHYERLGEERPADVLALCGTCHSRHHGTERKAA